MLNFRLPRTHTNLHEYINKNDKNTTNPNSGHLINIGMRNIYMDNITEQTNTFKNNWDSLIRIYYPYEFIGEIIQTNFFFTLRYAMHIELIHFLDSDIYKCNNQSQNTIENNQPPINTLCFYGNDEDNLNKMQYLQNNNKLNRHINIEYKATNIKKMLLTNLSSIDYITVGSHSYTDDEDEYARTSYICVLYTLCFQKHNGSAIVKVFNIDSILSIGIITLLTSMYQEVHIVKPLTSYSHSSEIFIVCKNFLPKNSNHFYLKFMNVIDNLPQIDYKFDVLECHIVNLLLLNKINEISVFFYQRRLENVHMMLNSPILQLLNNKFRETRNHSVTISDFRSKIHVILKINLQKCLQWTSQYQVPSFLNNIHSELNIFIDNLITNNFLS